VYLGHGFQTQGMVATVMDFENGTEVDLST
jgi:hypothetical protein